MNRRELLKGLIAVGISLPVMAKLSLSDPEPQIILPGRSPMQRAPQGFFAMHDFNVYGDADESIAGYFKLCRSSGNALLGGYCSTMGGMYKWLAGPGEFIVWLPGDKPVVECHELLNWHTSLLDGTDSVAIGRRNGENYEFPIFSEYATDSSSGA